jgi:hypothetical protein
MLKNIEDNLQLFSAKESLMAATSGFEGLRQCVLQAKDFLDTASVSAVLQSVLEQESNQRRVLNAVQGILHVGFLVEQRPETIDWLKLLATEVGLPAGHTVFESTIISRELAELSQGPEVPTTIFKAFQNDDGPSNYIEVLIPNEPADIAAEWIEQEVGTHVGFTLLDPALYLDVQKAFLMEGFRIPSFMNDKPMTNPAVKASAIYFDKSHRGRTIRIELCNCVEFETCH